jgi:2-C-methyl-D-erythritol 4-phosphate cytidylyltransferase
MKEKTEAIADILRMISGKKKKKYFISAIIVAAGNSERMQSSVSKQFLNVAGIPIIARTLSAFQKSQYINEIILVTRPEDKEKMSKIAAEYSISKLKAIEHGGKTRQESVLAGLEKIDERSDFVAIHDGARCLVSPSIIEKVCLAAFESGAATAAHRVTDTVKIESALQFVKSTPERDKVWLVQTPQVFGSNLYRVAAYTAKKDSFTATDDTSLVENINYRVKLVDCGKDNIKVTLPGDVELAEFILSKRNTADLS